MKHNFSHTEFFLGANTPLGFFSLFDQLYNPNENWFCHILKGGPGTGKSTLMKKIAEKSRKKNIKYELIRCSSDPKSLDAVILEDLKKCFVDGTSPHTIDPIYPGISDEIINLGEYWNKKSLNKSREKIIKLYKENSKLHTISKKYLTAFGYAYDYNSNIAKESINYKKLKKFCEKFAKQILKAENENGNEKLRFISSITPDGYIYLEKNIEVLCDKVFIIEDSYNFLGNYILSFLRDYALNLNHSIITCPSPFAPSQQIEALFVTDINLGFIIKNQFYSYKTLKNTNIEFEKISTKRFLEKERIAESKNIINFNNKICSEFIKESVYNLSLARNTHDEIESIYSYCMDYKKINKITQKLENF